MNGGWKREKEESETTGSSFKFEELALQCEAVPRVPVSTPGAWSAMPVYIRIFPTHNAA
jgi:hypothetical protein